MNNVGERNLLNYEEAVFIKVLLNRIQNITFRVITI
jgi:hypothetical protein